MTSFLAALFCDGPSFDGNPALFFSTPTAAAQSRIARSNAYYHCNCAVLTGVAPSAWNVYVATYTWNGGSPSTFNVSGSCQGTISTILTFNYAFDNANRITATTNTADGTQSWNYGYDALDRLTSAGTTANTYGWTYDPNGNRLAETGPSPSTYSISASNNQITGITGALARTYAYDAAGHTTGYAGMTATYDNAGRLKTVSNGSVTETLVYNALGQRIATSGGAAGTVLYWYDEQGHLLGEYDGSGNLIEETVWLGDIPVATLRPNGSGVAVYYVYTDQLNTPRQVTRPADNAAMWTWFADPFGTDAANSNPAGAGTFAYNLRLPGQVFDGQVGLHYNYFRDYDPAIGRYVESDPIGLDAGTNTYAYASGNPVSNIDPLGLCDQDPCKDLETKIAKARDELAKRADELRRDPLGLPQAGPMSVAGHQQQFTNKQTQLRKLLNDYNSQGCGGGLPADAWIFATMPAPSPAPVPQTPADLSVSPQAQNLLTLGAAAAILIRLAPLLAF